MWFTHRDSHILTPCTVVVAVLVVLWLWFTPVPVSNHYPWLSGVGIDHWLTDWSVITMNHHHPLLSSHRENNQPFACVNLGRFAWKEDIFMTVEYMRDGMNIWRVPLHVHVHVVPREDHIFSQPTSPIDSAPWYTGVTAIQRANVTYDSLGKLNQDLMSVIRLKGWVFIFLLISSLD